MCKSKYGLLHSMESQDQEYTTKCLHNSLQFVSYHCFVKTWSGSQCGCKYELIKKNKHILQTEILITLVGPQSLILGPYTMISTVALH